MHMWRSEDNLQESLLLPYRSEFMLPDLKPSPSPFLALLSAEKLTVIYSVKIPIFYIAHLHTFTGSCTVFFLTESGSLNGTGPIGSRRGTIWRCGLTGVGVALLEVHHCGVGLRSPMLKLYLV